MFTRESFASTCERLGVRQDPALFDALARAYDEPQRFYHTRTHVAQCLKALSNYSDLADNPAEIEMALWFHDAIYDPTRGDNEAQSAAWAVRALTAMEATPDCIARIEQMIIATATHAAATLGSDAQLMLDIDLGILGARAEAFEQYDADIRREYAWVPEADYLARRRTVLLSFLERNVIFETPALHEALETRARDNLARKVAELQIRIGPASA